MDDRQMDYAAEFAGLLLERRSTLGIRSQAALAAKVGVSEATVGRWERRELFPDAWELRQLAEVLGVTAQELLYPEPLTERERQVLRRSLRGAQRGRGQPAG